MGFRGMPSASLACKVLIGGWESLQENQYVAYTKWVYSILKYSAIMTYKTI